MKRGLHEFPGYSHFNKIANHAEQARECAQRIEVEMQVFLSVAVWAYRDKLSTPDIAYRLKQHPDSRFWRNQKQVRHILEKAVQLATHQ